MDEINKQTPYILNGEIRSETFGGLYYVRNKLHIEMVNESAFEIMDLIKQGYTFNEILKKLIITFDVDSIELEKDLEKFYNYLIADKNMSPKGKKMKQQEKSVPSSELGIQMKHQSNSPNIVLGVREFELKSPFKVLLELTYRCNLKCIHCFADADYEHESNFGTRPPKELSTKQWFKVIDNIVDSEVFEILLSGGEATSRPDLIDICEYIQSKGRGYTLLSNTTLIDDKMAKALKRTGCIKVESNLDGHNAEVYDRFRGIVGSFERTLNGIKTCLDNGLQVRCNVMETKETIYYLKEIIDLAYSIGIKEICVVPLEQTGRAMKHRNIGFSYKEANELQKFYKEVEEWFDKKYKNEDMFLLTSVTIHGKDKTGYSKAINLENMMPRCGAGMLHCTINPYGNVKLCPSDQGILENEGNNLLETSLVDIWSNSQILKTIRGSEFEKCYQCSNSKCIDGCPIIRYEKFGKLIKPCRS